MLRRSFGTFLRGSLPMSRPGDQDLARATASTSRISSRMKVDLPQPVGADEEGELAPLDRQRDAVEADVAAGVDDRRVAQLDDRGSRAPARPRAAAGLCVSRRLRP